MHACVGASKTAYPYGSSYVANRCLEANQPELVGTHSLCVGGYAKLFDMAGNVFEWEDQINNGTGTQADPYYATIRGNGFFPSAGQAGTRCDEINNIDMSSRINDLGFRCCK